MSIKSFTATIILAAGFVSSAPMIYAEDELELDTTFIKGNKELPQMMYIVPWQDMKSTKINKSSQNLTLHSLFGDIFDPVLPSEDSKLVSQQ